MALHLAQGKARTLAYGADLRTDLKLLEVSEDLLQELQENGLAFKGAPGEEAVLCSATQTFAVKNVETTNLVLMIDPAANTAPTPSPGAPTPLPGAIAGLATQIDANAVAAASQPPVLVSSIITSHLEVVRAAPRLAALDEALADRPLGSTADGDDDMDDIERVNRLFGPPGRSWEELAATVQCSEAELKTALEERGAVNVGGRWRGVDPGHLGTALEVLLLTAVERGWDLGAVQPGDAAAALEADGFAPELTAHCLAVFSRPVLPVEDKKNQEKEEKESAMEVDGHGEVALHPEAVCRHFGAKLLREQQRWDDVDEFLAAWTAAVPEGWAAVPRFDLLAGIALVDSDAEVPTAGPAAGRRGVSLLVAEDLPREAGARFSRLFAVRPRWELPALAPYLEGLAGPGETSEALLLRYARVSQQRPTDPVTYSAR